ncbi:(2Fe-2S) ferredoxin domain-containing protein [Oscillospiraceae bacterium MB08-C2-2]|nr:(2Fe-2S) ferredoxin domain-containing protein [Oscillospiraceae bacterium MB08-C2-2]
MKSLEELKALREKARVGMGIRDDRTEKTRVVVGMATCGIAAGARPVLQSFVEEAAKENLDTVAITQTGCIGVCQYEPVVEVFEKDKPKITYVNMTAAKAIKVVHQHLIGGKVVTEYTIGAANK